MGRGFLAIDSARLGAAQNVAVTTTSTPSTAFGAQTFQIRVSVNAAAASTFVQLRVGDGTPTAVPTDAYLPQNWVEYITVTPGQRLAAISNAAATLSIVEITQ